MRQHDYFWLDGVCCADMGIVLQGPVTFRGTTPNSKIVSVPGRSGDLHFWDGSYSNITGKAACYALDANHVTPKFDALTGWIMSNPNYRHLQVSNEPETYRLARVSLGPANEIRMRRLAPFEITFDCKPQRYLLDGERVIQISSSGARLRNPTYFPALPLITVYGTGAGTITVGGVTVQIKSLDGSLTLDCDLQDAYKGTQNKNSTISAPEFPTLPPGDSAVTWTGGITRAEVVPRWWIL